MATSDIKYIPLPEHLYETKIQNTQINGELNVPEILTTFKKVTNGWILNNNVNDLFNMSKESGYYLFSGSPVTDDIKTKISVDPSTKEIKIVGASGSGSSARADAGSGSSARADAGSGSGSSARANADAGRSGSGASSGDIEGKDYLQFTYVIEDNKTNKKETINLKLKKNMIILLKHIKPDGSTTNSNFKATIIEIINKDSIKIHYNFEAKPEPDLNDSFIININEFKKRRIEEFVEPKTKGDNINHSSSGVLFNPLKYPGNPSTFNIKNNILFTKDEESDAIKLQTMLKPIYDGYQGFINHYETNPTFKVIETFKGLKGGSGNTCWMNALFQVLIFHTEVLTEFLYNDGTSLKLKDSKFINLFSNIVIDYKKSKKPLDLTNIEKELSKEKSFKIFNTRKQQDAVEGVRMFDDIFEKEPYYENNLDYSSISIEEKFLNTKKNKAIYCSFIYYLFLNISNGFLICSNDTIDNNFLKEQFLNDNNNKVRDGIDIKKVTDNYIIKHKKQSFQTLELPLNPETKDAGKFNLNNLIKTYQEFEVLDSSNSIPECNDKGTKTVKKIDIDFKSKYIIIQLKRFGKGADKINDIVELEDITNFNKLNGIDYRLYGIICHRGSADKDGGNGHYVSFIKTNKEKTKNKVTYILCDDSTIEGDYTIDQIYNDKRRTPYVLFYERFVKQH